MKSLWVFCTFSPKTAPPPKGRKGQTSFGPEIPRFFVLKCSPFIHSPGIYEDHGPEQLAPLDSVVSGICSVSSHLGCLHDVHLQDPSRWSRGCHQQHVCLCALCLLVGLLTGLHRSMFCRQCAFLNRYVLIILILVSPIYTNECKRCILGTFPSSVNKIHRHITWVGFELKTFAILEQCLAN